MDVSNIVVFDFDITYRPCPAATNVLTVPPDDVLAADDHGLVARDRKERSQIDEEFVGVDIDQAGFTGSQTREARDNLMPAWFVLAH